MGILYSKVCYTVVWFGFGIHQCKRMSGGWSEVSHAIGFQTQTVMNPKFIFTPYNPTDSLMWNS